jgi:hypothetical protein
MISPASAVLIAFFPVYASDMHALIRSGFGPCIGGMTFSRTGNCVGSVAVVSGLTEADVDDWWRKFVLLDPTAWLACVRCHDAILSFRLKPKQDTRRTTLNCTAQNPLEIIPHLWKPGYGKTTVLTATMSQKYFMLSVTSPESVKVQCDICGFNFLNTQIKMVNAEAVHGAIRSGFNPFTDHRINTTKLLEQLKVKGLAVTTKAINQLAEQWLHTSIADHTDWRLCSQCEQAVKAAAPNPPFTPLGDSANSTIDHFTKKWWQFWR